MALFYKRLSYSMGNEDWQTEAAALNVRPGDRAFCITASGDRPLHLLMTDAEEVVSVDANAQQNHLLALKAAAAQELDYEQYSNFLGLGNDPYRDKQLTYLLPFMDEEAAAHWSKRRSPVTKGILYQGATERKLRWVATISHLINGSKYSRLFSFDDIAEQQQFVDAEWDTPTLRRIFNLFLRPSISRPLVSDPGLYGFVDPEIKPSDYLYGRIHTYLRSHLAKESLLLSMIFNGTIPKAALPPYLLEEGHAQIQPNVHRLKWYTMNALEYLEQAPAHSIDCFSMSDIASYMDEATFNRMLRAIKRTARPGARFCIRQFMSRHAMDSDLVDTFARNKPLEEELEAQDRCFVYDYTVGTVS